MFGPYIYPGCTHQDQTESPPDLKVTSQNKWVGEPDREGQTNTMKGRRIMVENTGESGIYVFGGS